MDREHSALEEIGREHRGSVRFFIMDFMGE